MQDTEPLTTSRPFLHRSQLYFLDLMNITKDATKLFGPIYPTSSTVICEIVQQRKESNRKWYGMELSVTLVFIPCYVSVPFYVHNIITPLVLPSTFYRDGRYCAINLCMTKHVNRSLPIHSEMNTHLSMTCHNILSVSPRRLSKLITSPPPRPLRNINISPYQCSRSLPSIASEH